MKTILFFYKLHFIYLFKFFSGLHGLFFIFISMDSVLMAKLNVSNQKEYLMLFKS